MRNLSDRDVFLITPAGECVDPLVSGLYASSFLASSRYNFLYSANFAKLYGKCNNNVNQTRALKNDRKLSLIISVLPLKENHNCTVTEEEETLLPSAWMRPLVCLKYYFNSTNDFVQLGPRCFFNVQQPN